MSHITGILPTTEPRRDDGLPNLNSLSQRLLQATSSAHGTAANQESLHGIQATFSQLGSNVVAGGRELADMARAGDRVAIFKLAFYIIVSVLLLRFIWGLFF